MVHIHAEGPAFFAWLPKMLGKRVVVTGIVDLITMIASGLYSITSLIGYAEIKEKVVERQLAFQSEVPVKQDELRSNPTS